MEKPNIRKKKKITTCSLSSFSGPLYGSIFLGGFLEVFAALSVQECQLLILLCFLIFLMFGRNFTLTNINWQSFHPCTFTLMSSLSYWLWLLGHQRKRRGNHDSITHLFRSQALHCIDVFLVCRCFGSSSLEVWFMFFEAAISMWHRHFFFLEIKCLSNTLLYKTYICLKVFAPSKRKYCVPHNKISLKKDVVSFGKKHILVCRTSHYSSW